MSVYDAVLKFKIQIITKRVCEAKRVQGFQGSRIRVKGLEIIKKEGSRIRGKKEKHFLFSAHVNRRTSVI